MPKIELSPGEEIYKYQLVEYIGGGNFGDVWLAHDATINSMVAVKILQAPSEEIIGKLKEAQIGNHLNNHNLVKVHYADIVNHKKISLALIVMDYLEKGSILNQLNPCRFLSIPLAQKYIMDTLRGLDYLHSQDYFHNDIKPSNILIGSNGEGKLTDYGISHFSPNLIPTRPRLSYQLHKAPETINNNIISVQTDLYQVGLTAFRLLNGVDIIFNKKDDLGKDEFIKQICKGIIKPKDYLPFIPIPLKIIINKAINPDSSKRYLSSIDMLRAMERLDFPGYWDCDSDGNLIGFDKKYSYTFEILEKSNGKNNFIVWKINKLSNRKTKISKYCKKNISLKDKEKLQKVFMQAVVTGSI